jgi:hypothetical protein
MLESVRQEILEGSGERNVFKVKQRGKSEKYTSRNRR